jgi:hypothetical protein
VRIFLSSRRSDVGGHAGRLSDTLVQRLGSRSVFQDVTAIAAGRDFIAGIRAALEECDAAIAVIGPGWLTAATGDGRPPLFEPDDYVRLELARVLQRSLPVAPVLVGGAMLPAATDLPEDLRPLTQRHAIEVGDESWHQDVDYLLRSLRGEAAAASADVGARRRALGRAAGGLVVAVILALLLWRPWTGGGNDTGSSESAEPAPTCPAPGGAGWTTLPLSADPSIAVDGHDGAYAIFVRSVQWHPVEPGQWELVVDTTLENRSTSDIDHGYYRYEAASVAQRVFPQSCFETREALVRPGTIGDGRSGYLVTCEPSGRVDLILAGEGDLRLPVTAESEPGRC